MYTYNLKDKIQVTNEFLKNLETKGWQEIEHLKAQIANIEVTPESAALIALFKNLLTSYYVFIGGLENISDGQIFTDVVVTEMPKEPMTPSKTVKIESNVEEVAPKFDTGNINSDTFEPFEYFVDFEEPSGDPISDEDLYGKK